MYKVGFWVYRLIFPKSYEPVRNHISASKLPWLFIGIEMNDGTIIDKTEEAQSLVNSNIIVAPYTIDMDYDKQQAKRYFYLDSETLKEEEIPADGIIINDS